MWSDLSYRLRWLFRRKTVERELDDELRDHYEHQVEKYVAGGMAPAEAARRARMEFGGVEGVKEECREARGMMFFDTVLQDCRYALRMMRRYPAFAGMAVVLIAMGIGASTSMFSLVAASVLERPQFSDRLVYIWRLDKRNGELHTYLPPDVTVAGQASGLDGFAIYEPQWLIMDGPRGAQRVYGFSVGANWFQSLDAAPAAGRGFLPEEYRSGSNVVILSEPFRRRVFARDAGVLGRRIILQGRPFTIVGILPPKFDYEQAELFTPMAAPERAIDTKQAAQFPGWGNSRGTYVRALATLRDGVNLVRAQSEMDGLAAGLARTDPQDWRDWEIRLLTPDMRLEAECGPTCTQAHRGIWLLFGAVGVVLLMACANVANLLLARSIGRRREFLIRAAIGCSRMRLIRQNLTETLLLFGCGGTLGLLIAWWSKTLLAKVAAVYIQAADVQLDVRVLGFCAAVTLITGVLFGLIPAIRSARGPDKNGLQQTGGFAAAPVRRSLARRLLVDCEFTLALVLLVVFGLLMRSFLYVESIPTGFQPDRLLVTGVNIGGPRYTTGASRISLARTVLERIREIPGIQAALTTDPPLSGADSADIQVEGVPSSYPAGTEVRFISAGPGVFSTLGIPVLEGRPLSPHDTAESAPVVVINQTMARMFFPNASPLGRHIRMVHAIQPAWQEIVGVVADVRQRNLEEDSRPVFYQPFLQITSLDTFSIVARVPSDADMPRVAGLLRKAVRDAAPHQEWWEVKSMHQLIYDSESLSLRRPVVRLLGSFGVLGAILAMLGLYAVLSYSVGERTREIGIRMALGARRSQVLRGIALDTARLIAPGTMIGAGAAYGLSLLLPTGHIGWSGSGVFLYGVSRTDAVTYLSVMAGLGCVAMLAALTPARRAIKIDPAGALRHE